MAILDQLRQLKASLDVMVGTAEDLLEITQGVRADGHEPDNADVTAVVVGNYLDNAGGNIVDADSVVEGLQEFVVCFQQLRAPATIVTRQINLATLVALARIGAEAVVEDQAQ